MYYVVSSADKIDTDELFKILKNKGFVFVKTDKDFLIGIDRIRGEKCLNLLKKSGIWLSMSD